MDKYKKFWDKMAKNFDKEEEGDNDFEESLKLCEKYLDKEYTAFDFACGTGSYSIELAEHLKKISAVDYSDKMIEFAERKTALKKINNIEYFTADIFDRQFDGKKYDVVLAFNILHLLKNIDETLNRIGDLLRHGGIFISSTVCFGEKKSFISLVISFFSKIGIVPYITKYKKNELENKIKNYKFDIIETKKIEGFIPNCFIAAKKNSI